MAFPNYLKMFEEEVLKQWRERTTTKPTLTQSTIRTTQQTEDDEIREEFEDFERKHYVIPNPAYISMLGTEEAYKAPNNRNQFLDNTTLYQPSVSTDRIAVYLKDNYGFETLFICIHGTKLTSIEDIIQDIQVIENSVQSSPVTIGYLNTLIQIRQVFSYIPNDNIYVGGHSLGAVYSLLGSKILNVNGYGFNGASSLINLQILNRSIDIVGIMYDLTDIQNYPAFTSYRLVGDPISVLSKWSLSNVVNINVSGLEEYTPFQRHSISTLLKVCIPVVPLQTGSRSQARRFNKLDDSRDQIPREGGDMEDLRTRAVNPFSIF